MTINQSGYKLRVELGITYNTKLILDTVECYENNPNYEAHKQTLLDLIEKAKEHIKPLGYVFNKSTSSYLDATQYGFLYCVVTLGEWIDNQIKTYFAQYEYLEGMMLNAFADNVLYEATNQLYDELVRYAKESDVFLTSRYEPGNTNIPMEAQKDIFDIMMSEFDINLFITSGYMLAPSKSLAYFYGVINEDCNHGIDHDCSLCDSITCKNRKYILTLNVGDTTRIIQGRKGDNLLSVLRQNGCFIEAPCSGKRLCGKCKITANNHKFKLSQEEAQFLTEQEKAKDVILACFHTIEHDMILTFDHLSEGINIEDTYAPFDIELPKKSQVGELGIAIDIGTTTIAMSLVDLNSQIIMGVEKMLNPQKAYGADVISRILYVNQNKDDTLERLIRSCLEEGINRLVESANVHAKQVTEIVLAGNTTMIYLLLGMDPESLAMSPFTTVDLGMYQCESRKIWNQLKINATVTMLPWISAYVGGDIVSGMYALDLKQKLGNHILIDIGTNGEMVLKAGNRIICASTAAGPAFEGANIRCGMGSVSGAICEIQEKDDQFILKVLGDKEPVGICGSALIDAISLLLGRGNIEPSGYMTEAVFLHESIGIYPEDVRQVQLAKAAIAAGVEVLLKAANLDFNQIDAVYLAGGFGSHLNVKSAVSIGLIHEQLQEKVVVVGNTSLAGCVRFLLEEGAKEKIDGLLQDTEYIELSTNMEFNDAYIMNMMFGGML